MTLRDEVAARGASPSSAQLRKPGGTVRPIVDPVVATGVVVYSPAASTARLSFLVNRCLETPSCAPRCPSHRPSGDPAGARRVELATRPQIS